MNRRAAVAASVAACAAGFPALAAAAPKSVPLPSATAAIRTSPPLQTAGATTAERRVPARVIASTSVRVVVGGDGRLGAVTALNRLTLQGTGDYSFVIPAPARDARPGPGSASTPGLRRGAVLWQGFVAKQRVVSALITLNAEAVSPSLPLKLALEPGRVMIENVTATESSADAAPARAAPIATALDTALGALRAHRPVTPALVPITGDVRPVTLRVVAPIEVAVVYRFGDGPTRRMTTVVGDRQLQLTGSGKLTRLEVTARPSEPSALLAPPRGASWRAYAASGGLAHDPVETAARVLLRAALATQYRAFLANPDPLGVSKTSYRYVLGATALPAAPGRSDASSGPWLAVGLAIAFGLALATGVVVWAHS